MTENINDESIAQAAITRIDELAVENNQDVNILSEKTQYVLFKLMKIHSNNATIQLIVFRVIETGLNSISLRKISEKELVTDSLNFINSNFIEQIFYIFLVSNVLFG